MNRYVTNAVKITATTGVTGTTIAVARTCAIPAVIHTTTPFLQMAVPGAGSGGLLSW